jgi:TRAP-type C4-dicarboxylate transport system substrate-binding protein
MHPTRRAVLRAAAASVVAAPTLTRAQQVLRLSLASGYPPVFLWIQELQKTFMPAVNEALAQSGNRFKVEWTASMSGTLAKIPAMVDAVKDGLCDVAHVTNIVEPLRMAAQNATFYAPFGSTSARLVTEAFNAFHRESAAARKGWDDLGLVLLTQFALDDYILMSKVPVQTLADLKGRKIGGGGPNLRWIEGSGAAGVQTTGAAAYSDMKAGVFDAVMAPATLAVSAKFHEVAPHVVRVGFGAMNAGQVVVNRDKFRQLPEPVQQALQAAATRYQRSFLDALEAQEKDAIAQMTAGGAKVSVLPRDQRRAWAMGLPNIAREWARDIDGRRLPGTESLRFFMEYQRRNGVDVLRDWDRA